MKLLDECVPGFPEVELMRTLEYRCKSAIREYSKKVVDTYPCFARRQPSEDPVVALLLKFPPLSLSGSSTGGLIFTAALALC